MFLKRRPAEGEPGLISPNRAAQFSPFNEESEWKQRCVSHQRYPTATLVPGGKKKVIS